MERTPPSPDPQRAVEGGAFPPASGSARIASEGARVTSGAARAALDHSTPLRRGRGALNPFDAPVVPSPFVEAAVESSRLLVPALRARFRETREWKPDFTDDSLRARFAVQQSLRSAAVLVPIVPRDEGPAILLTRRNEHLKSHAGQISLPGGRVDEADRDAVATALRETEEEVGIPPSRIEVLGPLPRYGTATGYSIDPVVGLVDPSITLDDLVIAADEVSEVFEVPLSFLMDPSNHERRRYRWDVDGEVVERHFYGMMWREPATQSEYYVWGVTAAILRNLYRFLAA